MKEHTKAVLEACTGQMVALGMSRLRRNLAVWRMNEDMLGGVGLQIQLRANRVRVVPIAHVVWEPVERLVALGQGRDYRPWQTHGVTRSSAVSPGRRIGSLDFKEPEIDGMMLERFSRHAQQSVVPQVLELADERALLSFFRSGSVRTPRKAEYVLAIRAMQERSFDLGGDLGRLLTATGSDQSKRRIVDFHSVLSQSQDARAILGLGQGARA